MRYTKERKYDTCLSFINYAEILYKNTENEYNSKEEAFWEFKDWILSTECNSYNEILNQTLNLAKKMLNDSGNLCLHPDCDRLYDVQRIPGRGLQDPAHDRHPDPVLLRTVHCLLDQRQRHPAADQPDYPGDGYDHSGGSGSDPDFCGDPDGHPLDIPVGIPGQVLRTGHEPPLFQDG